MRVCEREGMGGDGVGGMGVRRGALQPLGFVRFILRAGDRGQASDLTRGGRRGKAHIRVASTSDG